MFSITLRYELFIVFFQRNSTIILVITGFDRFVQSVEAGEANGTRFGRIWNGIARAARRLRGDRYDIQFSNSGSRLRALLQTVARGPGSPYYFFAPDADTLRQVFRQIADHLSRPRLSK